MLLVFQFLFVLFCLFAIYSVFQKRKEGLLGPKGIIFWIFFWFAVIIVVSWPNSVAKIADFFGIGRGADIVLYISIAVLFYIVFKLHIKLESIGRDITKITREVALSSESCKRIFGRDNKN